MMKKHVKAPKKGEKGGIVEIPIYKKITTNTTFSLHCPQVIN